MQFQKALRLFLWDERLRNIGDWESIRDFIKTIRTKDYIERKIQLFVTKTILDLGIPVRMKGFQYILEAIIHEIYYHDEIKDKAIIYATLAKVHVTTEQKIDKDIKKAIEASYARGKMNMNTFKEMFGYSYDNEMELLANTEYISCIANEIRLNRREEIENMPNHIAF